MDITRRSTLVYGLLIGVWLLIVAWQVEEHLRVKDAAKAELRNRSREIANTLSATIRAMRIRGTVFQERLDPVLNELVHRRTNELVKSSELISIVLLNTANEPVVSAGREVDPRNIAPEGERWGSDFVTFVHPVEGPTSEGITNITALMPSRSQVTNMFTMTNSAGRSERDGSRGDRDGSRGDRDGSRDRDGEDRPRRPPWMRWMDQDDFEDLMARRELHGLALAISTESYHRLVRQDLWLRYIIVFFAAASALGVALAWRTLAKTSELQIRLIRASEMNSHLKEMNLAAAGLAHETRNPLNIIRGMAQIISKQPETPPEIREKSRAIVDETDKVTAQLNEFINYSRPRELRRSTVSLTAAANEVVHALGYDIDEKKVRVSVKGESISIEADEQLLRQALFNLVLNAIQAVAEQGVIEIFLGRESSEHAVLEIRDNGPGVPPDRRKEIFKPYFTTHQKGTGLGLAVVQQIVLAHGWEIECLGNEPSGAIFRIRYLKIAG